MAKPREPLRWELMTSDEIASALAQTRESVKGKLHRARLLLREYLADQAT